MRQKNYVVAVFWSQKQRATYHWLAGDLGMLKMSFLSSQNDTVFMNGEEKHRSPTIIQLLETFSVQTSQNISPTVYQIGKVRVYGM